MVAPEALGEYRASNTGDADNRDSNCQYKQHPARCAFGGKGVQLKSNLASGQVKVGRK